MAGSSRWQSSVISGNGAWRARICTMNLKSNRTCLYRRSDRGQVLNLFLTWFSFMTRSSCRAWCGVIGRVLPKPAALMREALSETLPIRIATGEIQAYLPVSSDEGMAAGSGTSGVSPNQRSLWKYASSLLNNVAHDVDVSGRAHVWTGRSSRFSFMPWSTQTEQNNTPRVDAIYRRI